MLCHGPPLHKSQNVAKTLLKPIKYVMYKIMYFIFSTSIILHPEDFRDAVSRANTVGVLVSYCQFLHQSKRRYWGSNGN
jgi:hypothetical protein